MKMLAEDAHAEGVEGGDGGAIDHGDLPAEPGLLARGCGTELGTNSVGDTAAHFGGGGFGEGQDEEVVNAGPPPPNCAGGGIAGRRFGDEAGAAFGEDGGFAGAGGSGDEEITARVLDGGALGGGPLTPGG
jgi:hypothetical protein